MDAIERRVLLLVVVVAFGAVTLTLAVAGAGSAPPPAGALSVLVTNGNDRAVPVRGTVAVKTAPARPLVVQERRQPFQISSSFDNWGGAATRTFSNDVPEGKLLVIEYVTVSALVPFGQQVRASLLAQRAGFASHRLQMVRQGSFGGLDQFVGTAPIRAYAGGGDGSLLIAVNRNSDAGNGGRVEMSVSGHLIDP
jgi:hypothetical protein